MLNHEIESAFPALTGGVVTERHARICRERGHARHDVDGVPQDRCPRCGDWIAAPAPRTPEYDVLRDDDGRLISRSIRPQRVRVALCTTCDGRDEECSACAGTGLAEE